MQDNGRSGLSGRQGSIQARVMEAVRARIISGENPAGTSLSEVALAKDFGVSRTPVREALKQLETEGLVEIRPRVGTFVREYSRREINELFEVKGLLEGAAARLMAQRGTIPELDTLRRNVRDADLAVARGDVQTYARLVEEFHDVLITGADSIKLAEHYRMLMNQLAYHRWVLTTLGQPGRARASEKEHHRVLDLIESKDGDAAERVMRDHVQASRRSLMQGLDAAPGSAQAG